MTEKRKLAAILAADVVGFSRLALEVAKPAQARPAPAPTSEKSAPPRLSMVVLPFANIGGDPDQERFVDGVTESLSRSSRSFLSSPRL
jgi:hypothetical protein